MIFVTVGSLLPFDRLTAAMDAWAAANPGREVFGQVGALGPANHAPAHFAHVARLSPDAFAARCAAARLIVAHAGMGSILDALTRARPILVLPRRAALGETRSDHQVATARRFADRPGLSVAWTEADLAPRLDALLDAAARADADEEPATALPPFAEASLIDAIRMAIRGNG